MTGSDVNGARADDALYAVANAVATQVGGPVTIEDRESRVLAYSGGRDGVDAGRVNTTLGRRAPDRCHRLPAERAGFRAIHRSADAVVEPATTRSGNSGEVALPRVAVPVRAGDEQLGSICVALRDGLPAHALDTLRNAAKAVAHHLVGARGRAGEARAEEADRETEDLVRAAVSGRPEASGALSRLGLDSRPVAVLVLGDASAEERDGELETSSAHYRAADAFATHLGVVDPCAATATVGHTVVGLAPLQDTGDETGEAAMRAAADFLGKRAEHRAAIGIGGPARGSEPLARSYRDARHALTVLLARRHLGRAARLADLHADSLLLDLADVAAEHCDLPSRPVAALLAYDSRNGTQLVESLRAWLNAFGKVPAASAAVFVHPNTFRYRLARIREISGLDLRDADERFSVMLQLRLMDLRAD